MKPKQNDIPIRPLLIVFLWLLTIPAIAQTHPALRSPSIFKTQQAAQAAAAELEASGKDTSRITLLNELGKYFITITKAYGDNVNYETACKYLKEGVGLSDSLYNATSPKRYESHMLLAQAYFLSNRAVEGEKLYRTVIDAYYTLDNKKGGALAWYWLGCSFDSFNSIKVQDRDKMIDAFDHAIQLSRQVDDPGFEILVGMKRAVTLFRYRQPHAERDMLALVDISLSNKNLYLPNIYSNLAYINRYQGNLNKAVSYSLDALNTLREQGDTAKIGDYYGEIALEYGELGKSAESIIYYKKCIEARERLNSPQYVIYWTSALMTFEMIKIHRAAEGLELLEALKLRNSPAGIYERSILEHGLANCFASLGKFDLAEKHYQKMMAESDKNEQTGEMALIAFLDFTKFLIKLNKFKNAEAYYDRLIFLSAATSVKRKSEVELSLFKIDSARGRFPEAIRHYQSFKNLNDSVFNKTKSDQIEEMLARFNSDKKDQNIALLTKQGDLQQANLKQVSILKNSLLAGTAMLILLLTLLYSRYRLKTKSNQLLEKQQAEISRKNFAQQLLLNEKDWLVREIHHRVKNNFHMVVGLMGTQSSYIKSNEALQALEDSKHRIHTMSLIHQKLYQSENLSAIPMADYIHELVSYLKDSYSIPHVLFVIECERVELELSYSLPIGLILNEAITNSIKYAFKDRNEGTIRIYLRHTSADEMQLIISDNGVGIPVTEPKDFGATMGLNLMAGLTDDISGVFSIKNEQGTIIQIDFKYDVIKYKDSTQDYAPGSK